MHLFFVCAVHTSCAAATICHCLNKTKIRTKASRFLRGSAPNEPGLDRERDINRKLNKKLTDPMSERNVLYADEKASFNKIITRDVDSKHWGLFAQNSFPR